jgi:hypothetical protein
MSLRGGFNRPMRTWRDRTIVRFGKEEITAVEVRAGASLVAMAKGKDGAWSVNGRPADEKKVLEFVDDVAFFRAIDFAEPAELDKSGLDKPSAAVSITAGEKKLAIFYGLEKPESTYRYVRTDASAIIYLVAKEVAESLIKRESDFPAPTAAAPAGERVPAEATTETKEK